MRGIEETKIEPRKKKRFVMIDIGPSTEETQELLYKMYVELNEYRGGKTLKELVDRANDPSNFMRRNIHRVEGSSTSESSI